MTNEMDREQKVHTYILCYNEELILSHILDYYTEISSRIFIFDNMSSDKSMEIAARYKKVTIIPFDTGGKKDNKKHIEIKSHAYKLYSREGGIFTEEVADWVICVDTDEIVYNKGLLGILAAYKNIGVTVPQLTGFNMTGENEIKSGCSLLEQYKYGARTTNFDKCAIFDVNFDISYSLGCHPKGEGHLRMRETPHYKSSNQYPIALLHFKDIGSLLYESAIKNFDRIGNIKKDKNGNYSGVGLHYGIFKDKGPDFSPYRSKAKRVLSDNNEVLFENFELSTSNNGIEVKKNSNKQKTIDALRDCAIKAERFDVSISLQLMEIAQSFRPKGTVIIKKVDEYRKLLGLKKQVLDSSSILNSEKLRLSAKKAESFDIFLTFKLLEIAKKFDDSEQLALT